MGGAPSSGFSYPGNIPNIYNKDLAVSYEVVSSLLARDIGQEFNLGLAISLQQLQQLFPEFSFNQVRYNLYKASRFTYLGSASVCCINDQDYYIFNNSYITCPRSMKRAERVCDSTLASYCFLNPSSVDATHVCRHWLESYIQERGYDSFTLQGYQYCDTPEKRTANKFCDIYLTVMRENTDSSFHDLWLARERFECDSVLRSTEAGSTVSSTVPRVCWDRSCVSSPLWQLKYTDYITRLNCTVTASNISFELRDPNTLRFLRLANSSLLNIISTRENVYAPYLKRAGRLFIDFLDLRALIFLGILIHLA